jgi:hypothetical protein
VCALLKESETKNYRSGYLRCCICLIPIADKYTNSYYYYY